ncbi:hypothetical protein E8E13_010035 [Curvularia kusanoi]|uniref:Uncharacterized protein n=1 Tax=Curvularia kusanoi TaxID=90978 RepID=A0A9P4TJ91_CURKU|nr:hypothetical protein E8E13_010035 [Curvularia kusanoi]
MLTFTVLTGLAESRRLHAGGFSHRALRRASPVLDWLVASAELLELSFRTTWTTDLAHKVGHDVNGNDNDSGRREPAISVTAAGASLVRSFSSNKTPVRRERSLGGWIDFGEHRRGDESLMSPPRQAVDSSKVPYNPSRYFSGRWIRHAHCQRSIPPFQTTGTTDSGSKEPIAYQTPTAMAATYIPPIDTYFLTAASRTLPDISVTELESLASLHNTVVHRLSEPRTSSSQWIHQTINTSSQTPGSSSLSSQATRALPSSNAYLILHILEDNNVERAQAVARRGQATGRRYDKIKGKADRGFLKACICVCVWEDTSKVFEARQQSRPGRALTDSER